MGYSDHSSSILTAVLSASIGAKVIEKHFTLNKKSIGPDHSSSLNPSEFKKMIKLIRETEVILGSSKK